MADERQNRVIRFGRFEADLAAAQLRKDGTKIKIQEMPFRLLVCLLERPGEVVNREELRGKLWEEDEFVEFEHSLNTAVNKLRRALNDAAEQPRYIETVPRRGYRFIGQAQFDGATGTLARQGLRPSVRHSGTAAVLAIGLALGVALTVWLTRDDDKPSAIDTLPEPLTTTPGNEYAPSLSPDGERVAYVAKGPDGEDFEIYVRLIDAGAAQQLTDNSVDDLSPVWSPDGMQVAFARALADALDPVCDIVVVPYLGGVERSIGQISIPAPRGREARRAGEPFLDWSPNGRFLAAIEQGREEDRSRLLMLDTESRESWPLGDDSSSYRNPAFSPDGRWLAYSRGPGRSKPAEIYTLPLTEEGKPAGDDRQLTDLGTFFYGVAWTSDGRSLVFGTLERGRFLLQQVSADGGETSRISETGRTLYPSISRQGSLLVFEENHLSRNIWRQALSGRGGIPTTETPAARWVHSTRADVSPRYSPDGSKVAFLSARSGRDAIYVADSDGRNALKVTDTGDPGSPAWSPDSELICFDSAHAGNREIYVVSASGGQPRQITDDLASDALPTWSHDGRWIYFASNRGGDEHVWKIPADGGTAERVTSMPSRNPVESLDGKLLYFTAHPGPGLWRVPVAGGEETLVLEDAVLKQWTLADDGVYYLSGAEFYYYDLDSRKRHLIARETEGTIFSGSPILSVSPDGRWLAYSKIDDQQSDLLIWRGDW